MRRFLLAIIFFFFVLELLSGQQLNLLEEIVRNEDLQKLDQFLENWERESMEKFKERKKANETFSLLYTFFAALASSGEIYPFIREEKDSKWKIIQDSLRIKIYEKIDVDTVPPPEGSVITPDKVLIWARGEKLKRSFSVELSPDLEEGENLLLLATTSGRDLEQFLNEYRVRFYDVNIKKEENAVQKFEYAKKIQEVIGNKIDFGFFMDGILEWNLVNFPVVEEIEFNESLKKAIIRYAYLLEGGFALVERKAVGAKWRLVHTSNTWIR